uniref:Uncharacterized protein n=1 Tax=Globisporangium ultimum (strain ATCC 200006 / CBS 805.95 / DAOM BR144) TaxID=431595 RepID=K3WA86_GLOUD
MAQASKSLLAPKQAANTSAEVQGDNDSNVTENVTHEEERDVSVFDVEERNAPNGLAAVELEVQQEGIALSFSVTEGKPQPVCSLLPNEGNASIHELNETEEDKMRGAAISELLPVDHVLLENVEEAQEALVVESLAIELEKAATAIEAQVANRAELEIVDSGESDDGSLEDVSEGERSITAAEQPTEAIAEQPSTTEDVDASLSEKESINAKRLDESPSQIHAVDSTEGTHVEKMSEAVLSVEVVDSPDAITVSDSTWMEDEQAAAADALHALDATNPASLETGFGAGSEISANDAKESSSEATVISVAFGEETSSSMDELLTVDMELDTNTEADADQMTLDEVPSPPGTGEDPSDSTDNTEAHQATTEDHAMDTSSTFDAETQPMGKVDEASQTTHTEGDLESSEQQVEPSEPSNQVQHDDPEHTTAPQLPDAVLQESNADEAADDVNFDDDLFAFDASELLEMAERAAAAQLA